jgi:hypothetical protein
MYERENRANTQPLLANSIHTGRLARSIKTWRLLKRQEKTTKISLSALSAFACWALPAFIMALLAFIMALPASSWHAALNKLSPSLSEQLRRSHTLDIMK